MSEAPLTFLRLYLRAAAGDGPPLTLEEVLGSFSDLVEHYEAEGREHEAAGNADEAFNCRSLAAHFRGSLMRARQELGLAVQ